MKFYMCSKCNQMYFSEDKASDNLVCCEEKVEELVPIEIGDVLDHHGIVIRKTGNFVNISINDKHPMIETHFIKFIALQTNEGFQYKELDYLKERKTTFILSNTETIIQIYTYCNIHMLFRHGYKS